ncbi:MAG: ParB/RepB/Spo0J family partition protein [Clostridiales bacterium]|nr:ParB/RepB/Spo0J family partition protein [Clostridiales bacterium]
MSKKDETPPMQEQVQQIPISELHPFEGHPFRVVDDEAMTRTVESISQFGVISPLLARPDPDGGYEIISGHRRCHAAEQVGLETLPVIVREMDDDEAIIAMVDANLQRETILPSERAWAYKMKMDAIKHQGARADLTSCQVGTKLRSDERVAEGTPDSARTVQRYIRLTNLIPELMDMVDEKKIAFNPAVELSYLTRDEQSHLLEAMDYAQATPSLSQAQRLKKLSQLKQCSPEAMEVLMDEVKKEELAPTVTLPTELLRKYFPKSYTPKQMEDTIIRLLDQWQKSRQRNQSR